MRDNMKKKRVILILFIIFILLLGGGVVLFYNVSSDKKVINEQMVEGFVEINQGSFSESSLKEVKKDNIGKKRNILDSKANKSVNVDTRKVGEENRRFIFSLPAESRVESSSAISALSKKDIAIQTEDTNKEHNDSSYFIKFYQKEQTNIWIKEELSNYNREKEDSNEVLGEEGNVIYKKIKEE